MAQLPLSIICGTLDPTPPNCPPDNNYAADMDGSGAAVLYMDTRALTPCKSVTTISQTMPSVPGEVAWTSFPVSRPPLGFPDAAHPSIVTPGAFPLPPHCWGWDGSSDYVTTRYWSFEGTLLQIADAVDDFAQFDARFLNVTVDYDVMTVRRMTQRRLTYTRANSLVSFDFTSAASDACTDLSNTTSTVHHTDILYSNTQQHGLSETDQWNSLAFHDQNPGNGTTIPNYAFSATDHQNSAYFDPSVSNGQLPGDWGSFSEGFAFDPNQIGGQDRETWEVIYQFGRETVTTTNVRFTVTSGWHQFHCVAGSGGPPPPCVCNQDCPQCQGSGSVASGRCATLCANGTTSDTLLQGHTITGGPITDFTVSRNSNCSLTICAPCLTREQIAAGNFQGPYTLVWGTSDTCMCNGMTHYKTFTVEFTLTVDVVCPTAPPPGLGKSVSYDVSDARRHVRAYSVLKDDGMTFDHVKVGLASDVLPLDWQDVSTDVTAARFCVRWDRQSAGSTLYGLAELTDTFAGQIWLYRSIDEGNTWTKMFKVADGTRPCLLIARDGRRFTFWYKDGAISQKVYDAAWNVEIDTKIIFPTAVDDDFNVDEWTGKDGNWQLPAWYTLSGPVQHPTGFAARDGRRFFFFNRSGQVSCYVLDAAGNSIMGTFIVGSLGAVDDDQIAVDETVERDGTWYVTLLYRSGGKIITKSSKDGIIFA